MRKWLFLLTLCLSNFIYALPMEDRTIDPKALSELTLALGVPKEADIVAETQKRWLRKPGQERWEMTEISPEQKAFVLQWAKEHGIFAALKPFSTTYDKALIFGATTSRMQKRLDYLKQLWDEGTRFSEIVWLTGDRPLDKRVDGLTERCATEAEAARIIWNETDLPEEMLSLPVVFIAVPMKADGTSLKRPDTKDTIRAWLETTSQPCKVVFVSDQPFCGYQFAIVKSNLPEAFVFDVVGQGGDPYSHPAAAAITLDTMARWIYEENTHR